MFFQTVIVAILALTLGVATSFAGFRLFVILLPIWGFFAGFTATAQAIQQLFGGGFLATVSSWVVALGVGALFALFAYLFYYAAVVVLAATVGFELGAGLMAGFGVSSGVFQFVVGLAIALALCVAIVVLNLPKAIIIVLTALGGASMILTGVLLAFGSIKLTSLEVGIVGAFVRSSVFWLLVYVAIALVGMVAQFMAPDAYRLKPYSVEQATFQAPTPGAPVRQRETVSTPASTGGGSGSLPA
jgi:hypothetical protein